MMISATKKKPFSILLVDDEPKNLQLLGNILKDQGYLFEFATNAEEALEWVNYTSFDLILLDVMMPGMNGFEVATKIKEISTLRDTPIIFITAKHETEDIIRGFEAGAVDMS